MWSQNPSFRFEIEEFWKKKKAAVLSKVFVAGGCEWYLEVYPKGDLADNHLSVYLHVANPKSLRVGWKRNINFYFTVLNHRNIERCRSKIANNTVFDAKGKAWGFRKLHLLSKLKEKFFMGKDSLIVEVYIDVITVDGETEDVIEKETVDTNGFQVSASQVALVKKIFVEHPDIALGLKPKNQVVKTAYMNVLLGLINTLNKPSESHSEAELLISQGELSELEEVGFKIDWLKPKLDNVFLERKKDDADGSRLQQLEERVKNLEQMEENMDSLKRKIDEMEKAKADEPRVENLEERVQNLEVIESESGLRMDFLKSKLEDASLEKKKAEDADGFRVQQLEESVKKLEVMVSVLTAKLDQEKAKPASHDFLLL
ncbi:TRAF-like family protein [Raphanus sativus]|uniref:MATH domain and coiled-coil domain-containing protein At2g42480-like n=1 Tax=Raphanus sativus TaxID=3726 RepID=A0A6J0JCR6_RAPSA|nr:MATH domain and coiled-coil domain-containing protein At2g42480-like [Raphanus sativus]KAJ4897301.1 TRAF-like family protein [Raphanus sativus]